MEERANRRRSGLWIAVLIAIGAIACDDGGPPPDQQDQLSVETTRLCAIVPARDPAASAFPPQPPPPALHGERPRARAKVFGTDLGWTYERNDEITMLFGDSWQRIDICPIQLNDDSIATMAIPAEDWPGFSALESLSDADCPELTFANNEAGTAFSPIELRRWDGVVIPLGPLNTPVTAFHDGQREWAIFIVGGGQPCSAEAAASGATCPGDLSAQAADLVCGLVAGDPLCIDPTGTKSDAGRQAYYLYIAERAGLTSYVSRAAFLTNKYLNLTARAVRAFDPEGDGGHDYAPGNGALLVWGRPGFDEQNHDGEEPPYFLYHPLPLEVVGDRIEFRPRYFTGVTAGTLSFSSSQKDAVPLYSGELEPVNHVAVSWIAPLGRWLMIYGGSVVDFADPEGTAGDSQPVRGALYARIAPDPWGPWTDPEVVLTEEQVAQDFVCGKHAPAGCLPPPTPLIRPFCIELVDPKGGGSLYGANIIDSLTRASSPGNPGGAAADVFWNVSTWHPYSVVLVKTHVELD